MSFHSNCSDVCGRGVRFAEEPAMAKKCAVAKENSTAAGSAHTVGAALRPPLTRKTAIYHSHEGGGAGGEVRRASAFGQPAVSMGSPGLGGKVNGGYLVQIWKQHFARPTYRLDAVSDKHVVIDDHILKNPYPLSKT